VLLFVCLCVVCVFVCAVILPGWGLHVVVVEEAPGVLQVLMAAGLVAASACGAKRERARQPASGMANLIVYICELAYTYVCTYVCI